MAVESESQKKSCCYSMIGGGDGGGGGGDLYGLMMLVPKDLLLLHNHLSDTTAAATSSFSASSTTTAANNTTTTTRPLHQHQLLLDFRFRPPTLSLPHLQLPRLHVCPSSSTSSLLFLSISSGTTANSITLFLTLMSNWKLTPKIRNKINILVLTCLMDGWLVGFQEFFRSREVAEFLSGALAGAMTKAVLAPLETIRWA